LKSCDENLARRIDEEAVSRKDSFTAMSIADSISGDFPAISKNDLANSVEKVLSGNNDIFEIWKDGEHISFIPRTVFMKGAEFCSTPSDDELKAGIFIPGDFFRVFAHADIDVASFSLLHMNKGPAAGLLMPMVSAAVIDAKFPFSAKTIKPKRRGRTEVPAFSMKDFYGRSGFRKGDTLLFRVEDYDKGIFSFRLKTTSERRRPNILKKWCIRMEQAFLKIFDELGDAIGFREQMEEAFLADPDILRDPPASFEEFLRASCQVGIVHRAGDGILWNKIPEEETGEIPEEMLSISAGRTRALGDILDEIGLALLPEIVDSYMNDAMFRKLPLDAVYERLMKLAPGQFADEAQKLSFEIMMEENWERLEEKYNASADSARGVLRGRLLDTYDEMLRIILESEKAGTLLSSIPQEEFGKFSSFLSTLSDTIASLDDDGAEFGEKDAQDIEKLMSSFDEIREISRKLSK